MDSFSSYIYTDPMNNGIAKKIMSIIPWKLEVKGLVQLSIKLFTSLYNLLTLK